MNDMKIKLEGVSKSYISGSDTLSVLREVNLEASAGESVAVMGASGCGKSTLLNIIGGLDKADAGSVTACGYDVHTLGEKGLTNYRARTVGFVFQFHYLLKDFTARENIVLPAIMAGKPRREALRAADELLEKVNVAGRSTHYPSQLSGGERQRVALARALVNDPDIILADEPTGNLDEGHKSLVANLLYSLSAASGKILLLVTHAPDLAERADRVFQLSDGKLLPR